MKLLSIHHKNIQELIVGLVSGCWISLFLIFVGPFDAADQPFHWRLQVMFGYGFFFFLSYVLTLPIDRLLNLTSAHFIIKFFVFYLILFSFCLIGSFFYYQSDIINGDYSFTGFSLEIFLPTLIVFFPFIVVLKWGVGKLSTILSKNTVKQHQKTDDQLLIWKEKIEALMDEGTYLDPNLTLKELAQQLNTNTSVLSRIINQGYKSNFNDFINLYRVEAIKEAIKKGEHKKHTLNGIAMSCGFKSKATFNRVFKKHTLISPSEYIKKVR